MKMTGMAMLISSFFDEIKFFFLVKTINTAFFSLKFTTFATNL